MALPVHIIPQGLPADQTHAMILLSLQNLQCAAESVFERLEESFSREKELLHRLAARLLAVESKLDRLPLAEQTALKATSLEKYPEQETKRVPLTSQLPSSPSALKGSMPALAVSGERDSSDAQGQDTKELYAFFKQALSEGPSNNDEGTRHDLPQRLRSITSLQQFGSNAVLPNVTRPGSTHAQERLTLAVSQGIAGSTQLPHNAHLTAKSLVGSSADIDPLPLAPFPTLLAEQSQSRGGGAQPRL